ncbi:MAG TPA: glycerate kinase [Solirubrobacteraceae bacterium]|jgi:glycerate kinase|nr:glycerate kinase [Solirubrobacteraceae bacterium]
MTPVTVKGIPIEVLVAPDSFKGTLSASQVGEAVARGLRAAGADAAVQPLGDGGEGTLEVLAPALGLERRAAMVSDPLGREIEAEYGFGDAGAVVETAAASGLGLVTAAERDAMAASTRGTGELIAAAARDGARRILVAVGGSATTDGGRGAIAAIREAGGLGEAKLIVLCDVRTPFEDAARVFAPQKGASPDQVARLSRRLHQLARSYARDPRGLPFTGAAGGLSGGLWAEFGAQLTPGAQFVLDEIGFDVRMRQARAVITGEGKLDFQSLAGKAVAEVATRCRQAGVPCHAVVGKLELDLFSRRILDLQMVLEAGTPADLERAGRELAERL